MCSTLSVVSSRESSFAYKQKSSPINLRTPFTGLKCRNFTSKPKTPQKCNKREMRESEKVEQVFRFLWKEKGLKTSYFARRIERFQSEESTRAIMMFWDVIIFSLLVTCWCSSKKWNGKRVKREREGKGEIWYEQPPQITMKIINKVQRSQRHHVWSLLIILLRNKRLILLCDFARSFFVKRWKIQR